MINKMNKNTKRVKEPEYSYSPLKLFLKSIKYCANYRWYFTIATIAFIVSVAEGVVVPIIGAQIVLNISNGVLDQIILSGALLLAINLIEDVVRMGRLYIWQKIEHGTLLGLQQALIRETLKIQIEEIDKAGTGKLIERLTADANEVASIFSDYAYWLAYVASNVGIMVTIFILSLPMFFAALLIALLCFAVNNARIAKMTEMRKVLKISREKRTGMASEVIRGVRDIKTLNASEAISRSMGRRIKETAKHELEIYSINRRFQLLEAITYDTTGFLALAFGCFLFSQGQITIPTLLVIYNYLPSVRDLFYGVACVLDNNKKLILSGNRLFEIIEDRVFRKEKFGPVSLPELEGNIIFQNVHFSFNKKPVINGLSLSIKANQKVAVVGKSGAGKTTIMNLLTRIYDIDEGVITVDGVPIKELDRKTLRGGISVVTQQPYLFNCSIKENLRLAKTNATLSEMREVCKMARIDDFIMSLPNGYNTTLGEGGVILSGGQKQRIAIARSLLSGARIILFDEATSALDNETQADIQSSLEDLKGKYTLIVVAHRLSTIIDSDTIFVLDGGKLVDSGTHRELLRDCRAYRRLYEKDATRSAV